MPYAILAGLCGGIDFDRHCPARRVVVQIHAWVDGGINETEIVVRWEVGADGTTSAPRHVS